MELEVTILVQVIFFLTLFYIFLGSNSKKNIEKFFFGFIKDEFTKKTIQGIIIVGYAIMLFPWLVLVLSRNSLSGFLLVGWELAVVTISIVSYCIYTINNSAGAITKKLSSVTKRKVEIRPGEPTKLNKELFTALNLLRKDFDDGIYSKDEYKKERIKILDKFGPK